MKDQHLTVAAGTGADSNRRRDNLVGDHFSDLAWDSFQKNAGHACAVERCSITHELLNIRQRLALHLKAAHAVYRLRRKADVSCDRYFGINYSPNQVRAFVAALDLHHLRATFFYEARCIAYRILRAHVDCSIRHISD